MTRIYSLTEEDIETGVSFTLEFTEEGWDYILSNLDPEIRKHFLDELSIKRHEILVINKKHLKVVK